MTLQVLCLGVLYRYRQVWCACAGGRGKVLVCEASVSQRALSWCDGLAGLLQLFQILLTFVLMFKVFLKSREQEVSKQVCLV